MNNTPHRKPIKNDLLNIFFIIYLLFFIYSFLYPSTCPTDYLPSVSIFANFLAKIQLFSETKSLLCEIIIPQGLRD